MQREERKEVGTIEEQKGKELEINEERKRRMGGIEL